MVDSDYVSALATANHFLHAWQNQDQETAILLLSDHLKQRMTDQAFAEHLSSKTSKPHSFEIGRGRKLAPGRYQFPVSLFQGTGNTRWTRPQNTVLVVVKVERSGWQVDKLP